MDGDNLTEAEEHDMYIAQLRDVFEGCDTSGTGKLGRPELLDLCDKLQLKNQSEFLVNELLVDTDQVQFDDFKESFINILSKTGVAIQSSSEEELEEEEPEENEDIEDTDQGQLQTAKGQGEDKSDNLEAASEDSVTNEQHMVGHPGQSEHFGNFRQTGSMWLDNTTKRFLMYLD